MFDEYIGEKTREFNVQIIRGDVLIIDVKFGSSVDVRLDLLPALIETLQEAQKSANKAPDHIVGVNNMIGDNISPKGNSQ